MQTRENRGFFAWRLRMNEFLETPESGFLTVQFSTKAAPKDGSRTSVSWLHTGTLGGKAH